MPGHEVGEQIARQRQAFALGDRLHRAPRQHLRRGLDVHRVAPLQREVAGTFDRDLDGRGAGARRVQRHDHAVALLGAQLQAFRAALADGDGALGADREVVGARRALDVVEVEVHRALVAGQQEPRQGRGQHHRIAHGDVARGAADLVLAPGHRHDADGAGEGRNVERDLRLSGADLDDAGKERERRLRRRAAVQLGAGVAAGPDLAARALHAVDELAVEIADLGRELALAEIIVVRRRRLVVGQVENADIDRGDDDAGLIGRAETVDLDRHAQGRVRTLQRRQSSCRAPACAPCGRSRTIARRWRGPACAAPARRADGARSPPHRRRCPSRSRPGP